MNMWQDKRVVILGAARQGTALARWLAVQGARVTLSDMNTTANLPGLEDLAGLVTFALGGHPLVLLEECDVLCLSGGVPIDLPIVLEARRRKIPLSNDAQILMDSCPAPVIGITGSAGKTTTTTLVGEMLRAKLKLEGEKLSNGKGGPRAQIRVWVGGNIGNPLISDVDQIKPDDFVVMELSSFQLELMSHSPHIACITNITPNHLDRHTSMADYIAAKKHIVDFQTELGWQVLNADNEVTATMNRPARTLWFSTRCEPQGDGAWMDDDGNLRIRGIFDCRFLGAESDESAGSHRNSKIDTVICHRRELQLMGEHNIANVLAASAVCAVAGAPVEAMRAVATTFRGVSHRLQLISDANGVRWYDDSIATAPERLMAALRCFEKPVILLCGGRDKHLPWDEAAQMMMHHCKHIVLFGEMAHMVGEQLRTQNEELRKRETSTIPNFPFDPSSSLDPDSGPGIRPISVFNSLEQAVAKAKQIAMAGDVVLLSPGGTSYDAFKDFAERGDKFREWVLQAIPSTPDARSWTPTTQSS